ncbi:MAG: hypothetical protein JWO80_3077 [Bryobacterales bacterium]|nr:hypothetical protein [Bryobacterales bacterium]
MSYFNLEFNPQMATSLVHCLNQRYKGARKFTVTAPDAQGTLIVWALDPKRVPRTSLERVVRPSVREKSRWSRSMQPRVHLLRGKNAKPGPQQFRHEGMALHESGLPTQFRHRP